MRRSRRRRRGLLRRRPWLHVGELHQNNPRHENELRQPLDTRERAAEHADRKERGEERLDLIRDLEQQRVQVAQRYVQDVILQHEADRGHADPHQFPRPREREQRGTHGATRLAGKNDEAYPHLEGLLQRHDERHVVLHARCLALLGLAAVTH
jgi:hypothetical protein